MVVIPLETISTVFGATQTLFCLSVLTDNTPILEWSSDAVCPDLTDIITNDDLPMHTESISLSITVDSRYCGNYICNETFAVNRLSETVRVDVGECNFTSYSIFTLCTQLYICRTSRVLPYDLTGSALF